MKTKLKMALSLILSAIVIFSSIAIGGMFASADDAVTYDFNSETGVLTISGKGEATSEGVDSCSDYKYDYQLKEIIINEGITSIADNFHSNHLDLNFTKVTLPNGLLSIGEYAFSGCNYLKEINIPDTVTKIGKYAFYRCTSLTEISIPKGVDTINEGTFCACTSLKTVTMTDSVTTIGNGAFQYCCYLSTLALSKNLTSVGEDAFLWCASLSELHIPKGLDLIGDWAFYGLESLENISVDPENKKFTVVDGVLFNADKTELILYPAYKEGTSYKVPDTVTTICYGAFDLFTGNVKTTYNGSKAQWEQIEIVGGFNSGIRNYVEFANDCKHTETKAVNAVPATCTAGGYSGDIYCAECGEKIKDNAETAALGHDLKTETKAASFFKDGLKTTKCARCGEVIKTEVLPSTIHRILNWFKNIFKFAF